MQISSQINSKSILLFKSSFQPKAFTASHLTSWPMWPRTAHPSLLLRLARAHHWHLPISRFPIAKVYPAETVTAPAHLVMLAHLDSWPAWPKWPIDLASSPASGNHGGAATDGLTPPCHAFWSPSTLGTRASCYLLLIPSFSRRHPHRFPSRNHRPLNFHFIANIEVLHDSYKWGNCHHRSSPHPLLPPSLLVQALETILTAPCPTTPSYGR
jgi:hypothetical protein